jgi:hypothetical protein
VAQLAILSVSILLILGCRDSPPRLTTIPVEGRLLIDGKPFGPVGSIDFSPVISGDPDFKNPLPGASRSVADDGSFALRTYEETDCIPEGNYEVSLTSDMIDLQEIPAVKPFTIEIKKSETGTLKLEIKLESDPSGGSMNEP